MSQKNIGAAPLAGASQPQAVANDSETAGYWKPLLRTLKYTTIGGIIATGISMGIEGTLNGAWFLKWGTSQIIQADVYLGLVGIGVAFAGGFTYLGALAADHDINRTLAQRTELDASLKELTDKPLNSEQVARLHLWVQKEYEGGAQYSLEDSGCALADLGISGKADPLSQAQIKKLFDMAREDPDIAEELLDVLDGDDRICPR